MGFYKKILNIILSVFNFFIRFTKIKRNRISFISLEENKLKDDFNDIYLVLKKDDTLDLKTVLFDYNKKSLINNFLYMCNCIKQLIVINTSKIVILKDNNYVVSNFKRKGVIVVQVWHASGAIKKFGNVIKRQYPIKNYDVIISNSDYWKKPYSEAFSVKENHVVTTGMPRLDKLTNKDYIDNSKDYLFNKYPKLKDKKIILYAPTFRGNIIDGFKTLPFNGDELVKSISKDFVLIYKYHPLLHNHSITRSKNIYDLSMEDTHKLFCITDILISDYSSVIFDFMLFNKPIIKYIPDYDEYMRDLGCFTSKDQIPGLDIKSISELSTALNDGKYLNYDYSNNQFIEFNDGKNIDRVIELIYKLIKA